MYLATIGTDTEEISEGCASDEQTLSEAAETLLTTDSTDIDASGRVTATAGPDAGAASLSSRRCEPTAASPEC